MTQQIKIEDIVKHVNMLFTKFYGEATIYRARR